MAVGFFEVKLAVRHAPGGEVRLAPPAALKDASYRFVVVNQGGKEALVAVEGSEASLKQIAESRGCRRLTPSEAADLQQSYPRPALKQRYRLHSPADQAAAMEPESAVELDPLGNPVVETLQTVRSDFYLIDVPVSPEMKPSPAPKSARATNQRKKEPPA